MVYVDISTLSDGLHEISLHPSAEDLDLDPETFSAIETTVRLDLGERQLLCRIEAASKVLLVCDRTLEAFVEVVRGEHTVVFAKERHETVGEDDEIVLIDAGASRIDITEFVRDTLLLSVPLRKVAPSAREKELQLQYGSPEGVDAVDPRWEALRKLKTGS